MTEPTPDWLQHFREHLAAASDVDLTLPLIAQLIREALEIAEAPKYATEKSRFSFGFEGATDADLAEVRSHLSPFENSIVELKQKK